MPWLCVCVDLLRDVEVEEIHFMFGPLAGSALIFSGTSSLTRTSLILEDVFRAFSHSIRELVFANTALMLLYALARTQLDHQSDWELYTSGLHRTPSRPLASRYL